MIQKIGRWFRNLLSTKPEPPKPRPLPIPDNGVYIPVAEAKEIIKTKFGMIHPPHLADSLYYCPSAAYVESLLEKDLTDRKTYADESFDCDDFAWMLKAAFCEDAYRNGQRRAAHAMGIIWGEFPHPHAINWVITDDKRLLLIEPQTDKWVQYQGGKVYMMAG